jgi:hypothetical protein
MSSERQIAASRANGRKSRGPRTAAGKFVASRNAHRHGLAAATHHQGAPSQDIERLAKSLCHRDDNPALFEQALVIANNELVLRAISPQQLAVVERLQEPSAKALAKGTTAQSWQGHDRAGHTKRASISCGRTRGARSVFNVAGGQPCVARAFLQLPRHEQPDRS